MRQEAVREAEVHQDRPSVGSEHDVVRADVAVQHPSRVSRLESSGEAFSVSNDVDNGKIPILPDARAQRTAFDELHRHPQPVAFLEDLEDGCNVRVRESRGGLGFSQESMAIVSGTLIGTRCFERDDATELEIARLIDDAHAAPSKLGDDLIVTEDLTGDCGG